MLLNFRLCLIQHNQCRKFASIYTKTLNLPKSKFPAYINKTKRAEHDKKIREKYLKPVYNWQRENLQGTEFVLHDGPPYANGDVHMGHAVNKISKDVVVRFQIMNRNRVHYRPGWDCHGLPIESKAKSIKEGMGALEIREKARQFAAETLENQKREFESWGVTADWNSSENIYRTFDAAYIQNQLDLFYKLYAKELIFRDLKPVYWSPSSKTALAEAELEYDKNHISPSLYVRFKLRKIPESLRKFSETIYALVWTTTPWTLPANQAICFNPSHQYSLVALSDSIEYYIVATDLIPRLKTELQLNDIQEALSVTEIEFDQCTYLHPLEESTELPFLKGKHVTADIGTGLVHTAPAHGFDDHLVALTHKIPLKCVVDSHGKYNKEAPEFLQGKEITVDGNRLCLEHIQEDTVHLGTICHSCPIDWRTKQPVIINATYQWFINIEAIRDAALKEIEKINIHPLKSAGAQKDNSLSQKIKDRPYWCISRQRAWGTPIPAFYRKDTGAPIVTDKIVKHLCSLLKTNGSIDFWWAKDVDELIPENELKELNLKVDEVVKGNDILDIWFDSGISWSYALSPPNVADLYLEGLDQFTGWFQSSLITSVAARGISPFKSIFAHGFTVDEKGLKMSKSVGNVTHPKDIIKDNNIDALRWWVASHVIGQSSIAVKPDLLTKSAESVLKVRKTLKYLLNYAEQTQPSRSLSANDFNINYDKLAAIDKYILNALVRFEEQAQSLGHSYRFPSYINNISEYINGDLSALYFDTIKDKLYVGLPSDYAEVVNILVAQFCIVNKILWPIVPHLVEESWCYYDKERPFFKSTFNVSNKWKNDEFDDAIKLVKDLIGLMKNNLTTVSWRFNVVVMANAQQIVNLHKLHPSDGKVHNDSELCDILQVQSVQLCQWANSSMNIERNEIDGDLCLRCRRFAVSAEQKLCTRCKQVLSQQQIQNGAN